MHSSNQVSRKLDTRKEIASGKSEAECHGFKQGILRPSTPWLKQLDMSAIYYNRKRLEETITAFERLEILVHCLRIFIKRNLSLKRPKILHICLVNLTSCDYFDLSRPDQS